MALAHRFAGVNINEPGVKQTLNILESAPDTFPKGRGAGQWNQDFRWIRDIEDKDTPALYSGLDFMAPLMVAGATPDSVASNRTYLLDALAPKTDEVTSMGPFILPFQGPITGKDVFTPKAGGTQPETTVYDAVVFDRQVGTDSVVVTIPTLDGGTEDVTFTQGDRCSKLIAAPLTAFGVKIKSASASARGNLLISTSD